MGCYVRGDKISMGFFVQGGKSLWDVLSGVAKNGMGCFVPGCFVRLPVHTPWSVNLCLLVNTAYPNEVPALCGVSIRSAMFDFKIQNNFKILIVK